MGIFGVDVSNYQSSFDFSGWDFAILKASEGANFKDRMFTTHLANARRANCVVAAYHYVRLDPADYQVGNIESMVPKDVPVILDIERGAGSDPDHWRHLINELRARGYTVPLIYIPRWFWNEIGQPSLHDLPPLWMSWYPDYVARPREEAISKVPASAWAPMDSIPVYVMQFTSTPFDQDYYPGTKEDLANLFGGEDMQLSDEDINRIWMFPLRNEQNVDGNEETHEAVLWVTEMADRTAKLEREAAIHRAELDARIAEVKDQNQQILAAITALSGGSDVDAVAEKAKQKIVDDLND
jgi:hypothetical protein